MSWLIQALPPTFSRKYLQGKNDIKCVDATFFPSTPASSYMPDFQKCIRQQHSESQDIDDTSIDSNYTQKMQQHAKHLHEFCLWLHKNFEKDTSFATYVDFLSKILKKM